jgi:hypothetical protein
LILAFSPVNYWPKIFEISSKYIPPPLTGEGEGRVNQKIISLMPRQGIFLKSEKNILSLKSVP